MPCTAGTPIVIDHNGRLRACRNARHRGGSLHDYDFDVRRALKESEVMRQEVEAIPKANCWCTHSCFIQESSGKLSAKGSDAQNPLGWTWRAQVAEAD